MPRSAKCAYLQTIGRTARIGNTGLATTFFNDRDEPMADFLVKILLETKQPIPDFFKDRVPDNAQIDFNDDSGAEEEDDNDAGQLEEGAWGVAADEGGAWGTPAAEEPVESVQETFDPVPAAVDAAW
jgi:ATP-dependent RNA helicase DDX3X